MGYGILRIAKRSNRAAVRSMLRHALREDVVANAFPGAPRPAPVAGCVSSGEALARLSAALRASPRLRKDTVQAIDVLITASHCDMTSWPKAKQDAYFKAALDFVAAKFGGHENILTAVIHRDETTPHLQILIMPRDPVTGQFQAVKMIGGPPGLRKLQDEFHASISERFGLLRGEKGSQAEHVPIRRFYAQLKTADKPIPDYKPIPDRPTWTARLSGKSAEIEAKRTAALEHNKNVRAALVARAKAAEKIHPSQLARAAHVYRSAVEIEKIAKNEQAVARTVVDKARAEFSAIQAEKTALERSVAVLARSVESGWHLGTVDAFSASVSPEYRSMLAHELGIELKPGRLVDQVRRGLGLKTGADAVAAIEQVAQARGHSFTEAAGAWSARQQHSDGDETIEKQ